MWGSKGNFKIVAFHLLLTRKGQTIKVTNDSIQNITNSFYSDLIFFVSLLYCFVAASPSSVMEGADRMMLKISFVLLYVLLFALKLHLFVTEKFVSSSRNIL